MYAHILILYDDDDDNDDDDDGCYCCCCCCCTRTELHVYFMAGRMRGQMKWRQHIKRVEHIRLPKQIIHY